MRENTVLIILTLALIVAQLTFFLTVTAAITGIVGVSVFISDGLPCSYDYECAGGFCVHGICRSTPTYCGDGYCDSGETNWNCPEDCPLPPIIGAVPPVVAPPPAVIPIPAPETVIDIPVIILLEEQVIEGELQPGTKVIYLWPVENYTAIVHNIENITEPQQIAPLPVKPDRATRPITSWEIAITVDQADLCVNYEGLLNGIPPESLTAYEFNVTWKELPEEKITRDFERNIFCARIIGTPYLIAGFVEVPPIPAVPKPIRIPAWIFLLVIIILATLAALSLFYYRLKKKVKPKARKRKKRKARKR